MTAKLTASEMKKAQPKRPRGPRYQHQSHIAAVRNVVMYLELGLPSDATPLEKFYFRQARKDEEKFGQRVMALEREWLRSPRKLQGGKGKPFGQRQESDPGADRVHDLVEEWFAKQDQPGHRYVRVLSRMLDFPTIGKEVEELLEQARVLWAQVPEEARKRITVLWIRSQAL